VREKLPGRKFRNGVSELIVILTLVAIAIPIALALQSWLTSQASRTSSNSTVPNLEAILISKSTNTSKQMYVVKLRNLGNYRYDLGGGKLNAFAILSNGSVINASNSTIIPSSTSTLEPGNSVVISLTFSTTGKVRSIVIMLTNIDMGTVESVEVNVA